MAMRAFGWVAILVGTFLSNAYGGETKRYVLSESHPDGSRTLLVIDEDPSLRANQSVLSQKVVFKRRYPLGKSADFDSAKARYESERSSSVGDLRLPRAGSPLWVAVKDQWTSEDEDAYSRWYSENVRSDFLRGTGLNADCADVGLIFRWVYARNNRLPIANTMVGSGKLFGNFTGSEEWDALPTDADWRRDERFKAAMRALFNHTYTWSINDDQYPTVITRQYVRPGSMYMVIRDVGGHTQTIASLDAGTGIRTFWGNEPGSEYVHYSGLIEEFPDSRGFSAWRNVRRSIVAGRETWTLIPGAQMPGYSREQFEQGGLNSLWMDWIYTRLEIPQGDEDRLSRYVDAFKDGISLRAIAVHAAREICALHPCPPDGADYDVYSTYMRDARVLQFRASARAIIAKLGENDPRVVEALRWLEDDIDGVAGSGLTLLKALREDGIVESWSSDPNDSFLRRWGLENAPPSSFTYGEAATDLAIALGARISSVYEGFNYCGEHTCTGGTSEELRLDTTQIDRKIRSDFEKLRGLYARPEVGDEARDWVRAWYQDKEVHYADSPVCTGNAGGGVRKCTAQDMFFGPGAVDRVARWTSAAKDPLNSRWGL